MYSESKGFLDRPGGDVDGVKLPFSVTWGDRMGEGIGPEKMRSGRDDDGMSSSSSLVRLASAA